MSDYRVSESSRTAQIALRRHTTAGVLDLGPAWVQLEFRGLLLIDGTPRVWGATLGADFEVPEKGLIVVFRPGDVIVTIDIPIVDDKRREPPEAFSIHLLRASPGVEFGRGRTARVTIQDDDDVIEFDSASVELREGAIGLSANIVRRGLLNEEATVTLSISPEGTAGRDLDYTLTVDERPVDTEELSVVFRGRPGPRERVAIHVDVIPDLCKEDNEALILTLDRCVGARLGTRRLNVMIQDNNTSHISFRDDSYVLCVFESAIDIKVVRSGDKACSDGVDLYVDDLPYRGGRFAFERDASEATLSLPVDVVLPGVRSSVPLRLGTPDFADLGTLSEAVLKRAATHPDVLFSFDFDAASVRRSLHVDLNVHRGGNACEANAVTLNVGIGRIGVGMDDYSLSVSDETLDLSSGFTTLAFGPGQRDIHLRIDHIERQSDRAPLSVGALLNLRLSTEPGGPAHINLSEPSNCIISLTE